MVQFLLLPSHPRPPLGNLWDKVGPFGPGDEIFQVVFPGVGGGGDTTAQTLWITVQANLSNLLDRNDLLRPKSLF